jgi:hypothetical protein
LQPSEVFLEKEFRSAVLESIDRRLPECKPRNETTQRKSRGSIRINKKGFRDFRSGHLPRIVWPCSIAGTPILYIVRRSRRHESKAATADTIGNEKAMLAAHAAAIAGAAGVA